MKKLITTILILIPTISWAAPKFGTLKETMKEMGALLKTISLQIDNPAQNTKSALLADDIVQFSKDSKEFIPDLIAKAPAAQQAAMKTQYATMLDESVTYAQNLADAIRSNDSVQAKKWIDALTKNKKDGHVEFK